MNDCMKARKREIWILLIVVSFCAVLIGGRALKQGVSFDPDQLVIETRYSQRNADNIWLRRGDAELFKIPLPFSWRSAGKASEAWKALGPPQYTAEFMGEDIYLWEVPVRYDWDYALEQPGQYLAMGFSYSGYIQSTSLYPALPYNAEPIEEDPDSLLQRLDHNDDDW
jgi:hypothetical protein